MNYLNCKNEENLDKLTDLTIFPKEIQEMILANLTGVDLLNASKVCELWHSICERISKRKYSKIIPKECVKEIQSTTETEDVWLTATNYHYIQQSLINNSNNINSNLVEVRGNYHLCFCVFGPLVLIGCRSGDIEIYNLEENKYPVEIVKLLNQPIFYMEIVPVKNILLVKTHENGLEIFSLPYVCNKSWIYKIKNLKKIFLDCLNDIICEKNFSTYDSFLAVATSSHQINVYKIDEIDKKNVYLKLLKKFVTDKTIGTVSMWDDEIIVLCSSGEVLCWCFSTAKYFTSDRYQEICYENPVWIFRNRIFCSSIISSQLLGYWHMNRGADYWLVGQPYGDLVRCRDLGSLNDADNNQEYVLCVCLYQRLLACGTRTGKILLYYLSDECFPSEDLDDEGNNHLKNEFKRCPDLIIETIERPIKSLRIQFAENSVKIYIWPYMANNQPDLKGFFQCFLLKEEN